MGKYRNTLSREYRINRGTSRANIEYINIRSCSDHMDVAFPALVLYVCDINLKVSKCTRMVY